MSNEIFTGQHKTAIYTHQIKRLLEPALTAGEDYRLEAGVLTQADDYDELTPDALPVFDRRPLEQDFLYFTKQGGPFDQLYVESFDDATYKIDSKCQNCQFSEICLTHATETAGLELLGLDQSVQTTLRDHGVDDLYALAALGYRPDETSTSSRPYHPARFDDDHRIVPKDESTFAALANDPAIGADLPELIQRAQSLVGAVTPDDQAAHDDRDAPPLLRSGRPPLPEDDPPDSLRADYDYDPGALVRVYLNVQGDAARDRLVGLSARINAQSLPDGPRTVTALSADIPMNDPGKTRVERHLLNSFITDLFKTLQAVETDLTTDSEPRLHFYVFDNHERDILFDALNRHAAYDTNVTPAPDPDSPSPIETLDRAAAFHTLLTEGSPSEPMLTTLKSVISEHYAPKTATLTPIELIHQFYPSFDQDIAKAPRWEYTPNTDLNTDATTDTNSDPDTSIDLTDVFDFGFFNRAEPYTKTQHGTGITFDRQHTTDPDGWYLARFRNDAQIPLPYWWAAYDRLETLLAANSTGDTGPIAVAPFQYHNSSRQDNEVTRKDIHALMEQLTHALEHIERGITYRDKIDKEPIDTNVLPIKEPPTPTLDTATEHYLDTEFETRRTETRTQYHTRWLYRLLSGNSLFVEVDEYELSEDGDNLILDVSLPYDDLPFPEPERLLGSIRLRDATGAGGGDWIVASKVQNGTTNNTPRDIEQGIPGTIQSLSITATNPNECSATIVLNQSYRNYQPSKYTTYNDEWTIPEDGRQPGDNRVLIQEGTRLILDKRQSSFHIPKILSCLDHTDQHDFYQIIEGLRTGERTDLTSDRFTEAALETFLNQYEATQSFEFNDKQRALITDADAELALVQGPPGTGKTSGTLGPAIAARVHASHEDRRSLHGLVTAPSNTAVDTLLEATAEIIDQAASAGISDAFENTRLIRITDLGNLPAVPNRNTPGLFANQVRNQRRLARYVRRMPRMQGRIPPRINTRAKK